MRKIWTNSFLPKAFLKNWPKSNKSPNLVTLKSFLFNAEDDDNDGDAEDDDNGSGDRGDRKFLSIFQPLSRRGRCHQFEWGEIEQVGIRANYLELFKAVGVNTILTKSGHGKGIRNSDQWSLKSVQKPTVFIPTIMVKNEPKQGRNYASSS